MNHWMKRSLRYQGQNTMNNQPSPFQQMARSLQQLSRFSRSFLTMHSWKDSCSTRPHRLTQMESFIKKGCLWVGSYAEDIRQVIENCNWTLATPPLSRPVCSKSEPPTECQSCITIDIVYLRSRLFLHSVDNLTKRSETGLLRKRCLKGQIDTLKRIQLYRLKLPKSIHEDQEYKKKEFHIFCALSVI